MKADAFHGLAQTCARVAEARGTLEKRRLVADYLACAPAERLADAALFLSGRPFSRVDERTLNVGWSTLRTAALDLLPWDEVVYAASVRAVGDTGEGLAKLFALTPPPPEAPQRTLLSFHPDGDEADGDAFTLADAREAFDALATARRAADKAALLRRAWRRMEPLEIQYFTKIVTGGMRIGLAETLLEQAIADAFGRPLEAVREANMVMGDVGRTAALARTNRLGEAEFRLFHPLHFMLATPLEDADAFRPLAEEGDWIAEDKFDGVRAQLHVSPDRVEIYTRTLSAAAAEFPEVTAAAGRLPGRLVLDGEIVAWKDGRALPFGALQRRLGRKRVDASLQTEVPVRFVAYDLLYQDGTPLHAFPLRARRHRLQALPLEGPLARSTASPVAGPDELRARFDEARARGNEGAMAKRLDARYEFGKRGKLWLKLKEAFATLDVVVTAAEEGHGRRAGLLSDYTFAVRAEDGELLNVGKAYTGLTDEEIAELTRRFQRLTVEKYGSVRLVRPEVVLEVAFDGVQESPRHKSGYALRFPRIVRQRPDLRPEDTDTLDRVRELHRLGLGEAS